MEQDKERRQKIPFLSSLQGKYAMSYLAILAVVLVLLNTYPLLASQELLFRSKRDALKSQVTVMSSALMELEQLSAEQVARVMDMLDSTDLSRVMVTDSAGQILYDSADKRLADQQRPVEEYRYALFQEVVLALQGYDVANSRYTQGRFTSAAATPVVYRGMTIGAVYINEVDTAQGALMQSLQVNLRNISIVIAVVALVLSVIFSKMLTARITALLGAIRIVGQGEYGHRLNPTGRDELAHMAEEFNHLTDRLQTTEEVRRRFVSDASHELKTPLASIRLLADSILQSDGMDQETVRDFVGDIGEEAGRLARITGHLLTLTKLDSLPAGQTYPVALETIVERVLTSLSPVAELAGVELAAEVRADCVVLCSRDDLHQICFNLVENAIKYNRPGGRVHLSARREGDQILLEVADTGVGIPEEDLPKVFNRFYRVDKARSRAAGGTGLGLSIVRDTVRRHGGWVSAAPRQPEGTMFTVGMPAAAEEEGETP